MPSQYRQILKVGLPQFYLLLMGLILHFFSWFWSIQLQYQLDTCSLKCNCLQGLGQTDLAQLYFIPSVILSTWAMSFRSINCTSTFLSEEQAGYLPASLSQTTQFHLAPHGKSGIRCSCQYQGWNGDGPLQSCSFSFLNCNSRNRSIYNPALIFYVFVIWLHFCKLVLCQGGQLHFPSYSLVTF